MTATMHEVAQIWRGGFCESRHQGHVAIWHHDAGLIAAWGDAERTVLPRSACKMFQALPLVESGAAAAAGLTEVHLALASASHVGSAMHHAHVADWLEMQGLGEDALRCGPQEPEDETERLRLIRAGTTPDQRHNNCSGKHTGFLTLAAHIGAGPEYLAPDHPVQVAVKDAFEEVTDAASPGFAIDGCSAPNHATSLSAFARGLARFAAAGPGAGRREAAMVALREAMMRQPLLVAGSGRACTRLMRAARGKAVVKTGAEGVFSAILPEQRLGIAVKIDDGATRASEVAITALLIGAGVLDPDDPDVQALVRPDIVNRKGIVTGHAEAHESLAGWRL